MQYKFAENDGSFVIEEYDEKTAPLIDYYEKQGIVKKVDGQQSISAVEKDIADILSAL